MNTNNENSEAPATGADCIERHVGTPSALYAMEPEETTRELWSISDHIPEAGQGNWECLQSQRIEVKVLKDFCYDGRRIWRLATVWFNGKPVMVVQNAGREGDDHSERFVTNRKLLLEMAAYLMIQDAYDLSDDVKETDEIPNLTEFYNQSLYGEFKHY